MEPTPLEQSVFRTLAWFSLFAYPMTAFEVWKWLFKPDRSYDLAEVYRILEISTWLDEKLQRKQGFFALREGLKIEEQIKGREVRFLDAVRKYKKLRHVAMFFWCLPGVRAVAAANTLAWWHTNEQSDIDLYIITRPGMIWTTRLLTVFPFQLLGQRPGSSEVVKDPFCFSFFQSADYLQMEELRVENDYYLAFWAKSLVPIFDKDQCFEEHKKENHWANVCLPNTAVRRVHTYHTPKIRFVLPMPLRWAEPIARSFQCRRFPPQIKELANKDTRVVVNDCMLKFYPNDRREQYRDAFEELLARYL